MSQKVEKTAHVSLDPSKAFRVFAMDIATWWPMASHSLAASRNETPDTLFMEPRKGSRVQELATKARRDVSQLQQRIVHGFGSPLYLGLSGNRRLTGGYPASIPAHDI